MLISSVASAEEISLDKIWSNMPGTQNVRDLEPEHFGPQVSRLASDERNRLIRESLNQQIMAELSAIPSGEEKPQKTGFAVSGTPQEALAKAHAVLSGREEPTTKFSKGENIFVVFFSYAGPFVQMRKVAMRGDSLLVAYHFVSHLEAILSSHFALIPIGSLKPGPVKVEILQSTDWDSNVKNAIKKSIPISSEKAKKIVCDSFTFVVE